MSWSTWDTITMFHTWFGWLYRNQLFLTVQKVGHLQPTCQHLWILVIHAGFLLGKSILVECFNKGARLTQEEVYSHDLITSTSYLLCCYDKTSGEKGLSWFRDRIHRSRNKGERNLRQLFIVCPQSESRAL